MSDDTPKAIGIGTEDAKWDHEHTPHEEFTGRLRYRTVPHDGAPMHVFGAAHIQSMRLDVVLQQEWRLTHRDGSVPPRMELVWRDVPIVEDNG